MDKTIKQIAAEIGVSKQAVYKRAAGKLKDELAPYTLTKNNRIYITEEGINIIKTDFAENPCATPLPSSYVYTPEHEHIIYGANTYAQSAPMPSASASQPQNQTYEHSPVDTEHIRNTSGAYTEHIRSVPKAHTEQNEAYTQTSFEPHTEHIQNAYGSHTEQTFMLPDDKPATFKQYTEQSGAHTEHIHSALKTHTEQDGAHTEHTQSVSTPYTEQSGAHTDTQAELERLKSALDEKNEDIHQKELDLVRSTAEITKLEEVVKQLKQRLDEKDTQIMEQKQIIQKTDDERKILTASLFRNNEIIESLMKLPLSKRIFGWKNVQKNLMSSRNETDSDDNTVDILQDDDSNDES